MIVVKVRGGLGNQLFQYACGRRLALAHGGRVRIDPSLWMAEPRQHDRPLRLWDFMVEAEMATEADLAAVAGRLVREEPFGFRPAALRLPDDVALEGYWQSESYFADAAVIVRRDLRFRDETLMPRARATVASLRDQGDGGPVVAVHVRRGDYAVPANAGLFHLLSARWYHDAMDRFPAGSRFLVFSDDKPWCRTHLSGPGLTYAEGGDDLGDLALMRACDHHIIANSSFSWWGAYLAEGANQQVIAPAADVWFGARLAANDATRIIPERWIRQPDLSPPVVASAVTAGTTPSAAPATVPADLEGQLAGVLLKGGGTALRLRSAAAVPPPGGLPGVAWHEALPAQGIDGWRAASGVRHVNLVSADRAAWAAATRGEAGGGGTEDSLRHGRVDYVLLHGAPVAEPALPAGAMAEQLVRCGYRLFRVDGVRLQSVADAAAALSGTDAILAVQERLLPLIGAATLRELDLGVLCWEAGIKPRGIIHVGAHEGQELEAYQKMGIQSVLFIEANPTVHDRLSRRLDGVPGVRVIHRAITDREGTVMLRVASFDQSSSVLPLAEHRTVYPGIVEVDQVAVRGSSLDGLVDELGLDPAQYNLLHLDIQGAEGLALRGATRLLSRIEGVRAELNFAELYAGCAQIEEIDAILAASGFRRKAMISGYHDSWGDGFYVRETARHRMDLLGKHG